MDISVIIPMYNSRETIVHTLNSIKNQSALAQIREIIVVNDGSSDGSEAVVQTYIEDHANMPVILINQENGGVSAARNAGLRIAKGEWIALLDSDDEWLPDKLEIQTGTLLQHPEIDFLGGDMDDKGLRILCRKIDQLYQANVKDVCLKMFPQTSAAIFRKSVYDQLGGYDEKQKYAEDGNYFLKICSHFNYYHLPRKMINYGSGKPGYGYSGLSANLKKMYEGNVKNFRELRQDSIISVGFYLFLRVFAFVKYLRRIILTQVRNIRNKHGA
jgi:glycosyltransferase involved in cell wall biosynthesis